MSSENTTQGKATRHDTTPPKPRKPVINARPLAALVTNAALVGGATLAAAGGVPAVLSGVAAVGVASAAAAGTRKTRKRLSSRSTTGPTPRTTGTRSTGSSPRKPSALVSTGARKVLGSGRKSISPATGTRKGTGSRLIPKALRRKTGTTPGRKPFRTPSAFRKTAASARKAATGTRKMTTPVWRKTKAAITGTRKTFRKAPSALRWLRNLWRKATGRPLLVDKKKKPTKKARKVADPAVKPTAKMRTPQTAIPAPRRTPHTTNVILPPAAPTERTLHMSAAVNRMQELADEMLAVSKRYAYATEERGSGVGLLAYAADCAAMPNVLMTVAEAIRQRHQMAEESLPVASIVVESQADVYEVQKSVVAAAEAAHELLERVEEPRLSRLRNPHHNERNADVSENQEV